MKPVAQKPRFRPETFGKFILIAPIATGGMGEIHLARMRAEGFERLVVIKRILPHLTDKPEFVEMFIDEARVAAQIHHPNVCQILEFGQIEGRYFMALEYLEGISLTQVIVGGRKHEKLRTLRFLTAIMTQVCEGLHHAHNLQTPTGALAGVVHRDVNPKNIFVTSAGVAKVIDFGIVKALNAINVTRTGSVKGTYSYMSPEQIKATPVDRRSDVFSLGTVTWEAITGVRLFKRENDFHTWRAITEDPIPPTSQFRDDLPPEIDDVLAGALKRERGERFPTARAFGQALEKAIESVGGPLTPVAVASRIERAFEEEFELQQQRTYSPTSIDDSGEVDERDFELSVDQNPDPTTVTPSAQRGRPDLFDSPGTDSDISDGALVHPAPITGSNIHSVPPRTDVMPPPVLGPGPPNLGAPQNLGPPANLGPPPQNLGPPPQNLGAAIDFHRSSQDIPALPPSDILGEVIGPPSESGLAPVDGSEEKESSGRPRRRVAIVAVLFLLAIMGLGGFLYYTKVVQSGDSTDKKVAKPTKGTKGKATTAGTPGSKDVDKQAKEAAAERERIEREKKKEAKAAAAKLEKERLAKEKAAEEESEKEELAKKELEEKEAEKEKREKDKREKDKREKEKREKEKREKERLAALPKGTLNIASMPFGTAYINGRKKGITPLTGIRLAPGTYTIKIQSSAGTEYRKVTIESGKLSRVRVKF